MAAAARTAKIGRLERPAITGVLVREIVNFSSYWRAATFSSTVEPTIYLLAFGFGFGSLVSTVNGYSYVEFVGTGTVATAVLFSSAFAAMFGTFVKYQFQRTYDAILAAPVDTEELVTAESLWIAVRAGVYGCVPMVVATFFGLDPSWGMLTVPFIGFLTGLGWANFGIMIAGYAKAIENFNYIVSAVLTPLFLLAGTFFPLDGLPRWLQVLAEANPLHQCVELVRAAVLYGFEWNDLLRVGVLVVFALFMWRMAISRDGAQADRLNLRGPSCESLAQQLKGAAMRFIPTKFHAPLDYIVGVALIAAPWIFRFSEDTAATVVPIVLGIGLIAYSLFTNYELGVWKVVPMAVHNLFDIGAGAFLALSPWIFGFADEGTNVWLPHVVVGLAAIFLGLTTKQSAGYRYGRTEHAATS